MIGERDTLQKKLAETQAQLAGAHENADALLVRLGGDPEGMSDAEVWHASAKAIKETQEKLDADNYLNKLHDIIRVQLIDRLAETQAIARELVSALVDYLSHEHTTFPHELLARAKGMLLPGDTAGTDIR